MRKRQVQIVLVCEDRAHESFIRRYLERRGYPLARLRVSPYPGTGRGSGKEFVRQEYLKQVREVRRYWRTSHPGGCTLVVLIDHDPGGRPDPYSDLDRRLVADGQDGRATDEAIALFVPKLSIQTWVYHLLDSGRTVDENTDYSTSHGIGAEECRMAGEAFVIYMPDASCPLPSLRVACGERERIPG